MVLPINRFLKKPLVEYGYITCLSSGSFSCCVYPACFPTSVTMGFPHLSGNAFPLNPMKPTSTPIFPMWWLVYLPHASSLQALHMFFQGFKRRERGGDTLWAFWGWIKLLTSPGFTSKFRWDLWMIKSPWYTWYLFRAHIIGSGIQSDIMGISATLWEDHSRSMDWFKGKSMVSISVFAWFSP